MVKRVLLVHAGAPDHKKDHHYVAQAQAYMGLSSRSTRRLEAQLAQVSQHERAEANTRAQTHVTSHSPRDSETDPLDYPTYVEDTQLAYTALESQLLSSSRRASTLTPGKPKSTQQARVQGNAIIDYAVKKTAHATTAPGGGKSVPHTPARKAVDTNEPRSTPATAPSGSSSGEQRLSQSSYLVTPILERPNKRQRVSPVQVSPYRQFHTTAARQPVVSAITKVNNKEACELDTSAATASDAAATNDTTSELPTSYSNSDKGRKGKGSLSLSQRSAPEPQSADDHQNFQRDTQSQPDGTSLQRNSLQKPRRSPRKATKAVFEQTNSVSPDKSAQCHANHLIAATAAAKRATAIPCKESPRANEAVDALPFEIRPPSVKPGSATFTTHITPALRRLLEGSLANSFKPITQSREIDPLERGCWHVHMPDWPPPQFSAFWHILERFIGSGSAGWGVWCSRGPDTDLASVSVEQDPANPGDSFEAVNMLSPIRLYCWGEVVQHTWLLLYVASNSKIRKLGAQWIDAEGRVVVQMRGK